MFLRFRDFRSILVNAPSSTWRGRLAHAVYFFKRGRGAHATKSLASHSTVVSIISGLLIVGSTGMAGDRPLRIAADPNNLPFSNDKLEGFENKIADVIADALGRKIEYTWRAQRRGFFRESLKQGDCDIAMGAPAKFDLCLTTRPYYRSSFAFVSRADRALNINSFNDPRLTKLKIGVQVVMETATPPGQALGKRGIVDNLVGYTLFDDFSKPNPPARIVEAVAKGDVDVAVVWGPLAGYFATKQATTLTVLPVAEQRDGVLPMAYDIAVGVRRTEPELRDRINEILIQKQPEIDRILVEYGVPRVQADPKAGHAETQGQKETR